MSRTAAPGRSGRVEAAERLARAAPAVGMSRTAATGRWGQVEAAERLARVVFCLRLLYHTQK